MTDTTPRIRTDFDIPQEVLDLYDSYAHGGMDRRTFIERMGAFTVAGLSGAALAACVSPDYARAQTTADDTDFTVENYTYSSPEGGGDITGDLVVPEGDDRIGAVVVVHENRGLNPYIQDVARRVAKAGYIALAPDALSPLGGYPGTDDEGRTMQRERDRGEMLEDFIRAAEVLREHPRSNGRVAVVGFCFGGAVSNLMAARLPWLAGAVPYYGGWPTAEDAARVEAPLLIHLGELDERVNKGWPDYRAALDANGVDYEVHIYEGANHGFHNDTTPRYDPEDAALSWERTLAFFDRVLKA